MPVATTWAVENMQHNDSDGGVVSVYWTCTAKNDGGPEMANDGGKLHLAYDASAPDYIPYDNLTEDTVLGWVYSSLCVGDETPEEAKARVEARLVTKVNSVITPTISDGLPWAS